MQLWQKHQNVKNFFTNEDQTLLLEFYVNDGEIVDKHTSFTENFEMTAVLSEFYAADSVGKFYFRRY